MFKKLITILVIISNLLVLPTIAEAKIPKFKLHVIKDIGFVGFNYSINMPIIIDYDGDKDTDILIISKEGTLYFLENLLYD